MINKERIFNNKAQAAVELAIFGTLILIAFSTVISYGQRLSAQQRLKQEVFRIALQQAHEKNSSVSYVLKKDVPFTNLLAGYFMGTGSFMGASASVMWQKGQPGSQGSDDEQAFSYYQVGSQVVEMPRVEKESVGYDGSTTDIKVPAGVWFDEVGRTETQDSLTNKTETNSGITVDKTVNVGVEAGGILHTRVDRGVDSAPWDDEPATSSYDYATGDPGYSYGRSYSAPKEPWGEVSHE